MERNCNTFLFSLQFSSHIGFVFLAVGHKLCAMSFRSEESGSTHYFHIIVMCIVK